MARPWNLSTSGVLRANTWLACATLTLISVIASSGAATERTYHVRTWTTDDGLPHNSVSRIVQDSAGFLWLATAGGLARFDGREFREIRPPAEYTPQGLNIRGLAEETPGTLIVLPTSGRVLRLTGSTWSVHPVDAFFSNLSTTPTDLQVDARGNVWFITWDDRLVRWSPDEKTKILGPFAGLTSRAKRGSLAADASDRVWISADSLWSVSENGTVTQHTLDTTEPGPAAPARNGGIWMWTEQRLLQLEHGHITGKFDLAMQGNLGRIRHLFEDSSGTLWIASSRQGLFYYAEGHATRISNYSSASFVMEDREGNIWVATDGSGVGLLREKSYRLFNTTNGLPQEAVSSVCEDSAGRTWLANRAGGLLSIGPDGVPQNSGLSGSRTFANTVCVDTQNRLWFGGGGNGLLRWDPEKGDALVQLPSPSSDLNLLFRASNGDMWFAGRRHSLGFYRGDELHMLSAAEGFVQQEIQAIAEDTVGNIWFGGRRGELLCWDGHRVKKFDVVPGLPAQPIHTIWADAANRLWIGTARGLVLKDAAQFRLLNQADGLGDDIIQQILEDDRGHLWFAARRGLFYANKAELLAVAGGEKTRVESHRLGPNQGLVGLSPTPNYHPAAWKASDGRLWFATAQGAVVVDPTRLTPELLPPPVLIDEVRLDGQILSAEAAKRIPSGQHRIEFRFAALSYTAPEDVRLRHQLEGADPHWIDTGSDRSVSYTNLAPKAYRLRVIARNSAGSWNNTGATLAFTVVPAWWETIGFRLSAAILLTASTAWLARTIAQRRLQDRLRRLEQEHALEKERARIARDLHDDLGSSLTEVGLLADRLVEGAPSELAPHLSGLAWRTRRLATDLSGIVWTMNASNSSLDRLAHFLQRYAERLFRSTGTRCVVTGIESVPAVSLAPDPQHHLIAITKEALNNILKHAHATEACLDLRYAKGIFQMRISDNGAGFFVTGEIEHDGNGLRNMGARVKEIGGVIEVASTPGAGTTVLIRISC